MSQPHEDRFGELFSGSEFSADEVEFFRTIDRYKRRSGRLFLSWHEVLRIARKLGYAASSMTTSRKRRHNNSPTAHIS